MVSAKYLALIACLFATGAVAAPGGPSAILVVDTLAHMTGLPASALKTNPDIQLLGYNAVGDGGGGLFHYFSGSAASADSCRVFSPSAGSGRIIRQGVPAAIVSLDQCGSYGDGVVSSTGVANGSTTFTDASANCTAAASAGKTHITIFPKPGTSNTQVNTTFSCNSGTSFLLASGPSWSGTAVTYVIGHDDGTAYAAAQALANSVSNGVLTFSQPVYLLTSLSNGIGTVTSGMSGVGSIPSIIVVGGLGAGKNGVTIAPAGVAARYENFYIYCGFAGQDCGEWTTATSGAVIRNVGFWYANRNCLELDGGASMFDGIESASWDTGSLRFCGLHGIDINLTNSAYFNISQMLNFDIRAISQRQASGTCVHGTGSGFQVQNIRLAVFECDAKYGASAQSTFLPLSNAVYFDLSGAGTYNLDFRDFGVENTGGTAVCSGRCEIVGMNTGTNFSVATAVSMNACQMAGAASWATETHYDCYNAAGVFALAGSGSKTVLRAAAFTGNPQGVVTINNDDGAGNASIGQWQFLGNNGTPVYAQIGTTATTGSGNAFTTTGTAPSAVNQIAVTNTGATGTISYVYRGTVLNEFVTQ